MEEKEVCTVTDAGSNMRHTARLEHTEHHITMRDLIDRMSSRIPAKTLRLAAANAALAAATNAAPSAAASPPSGACSPAPQTGEPPAPCTSEKKLKANVVAVRVLQLRGSRLSKGGGAPLEMRSKRGGEASHRTPKVVILVLRVAEQFV
ncbi:hypothetical protein MTO96_043649 [Rhipicephalus appendiculatus]